MQQRRSDILYTLSNFGNLGEEYVIGGVVLVLCGSHVHLNKLRCFVVREIWLYSYVIINEAI